LFEGAAMMTSSQSRSERFEAFVDAHRDFAVRIAWQLLGAHHSMAEDIAQQAFMKAWDHLPRFRDDAKLETWFNRILVNQVRSHQRWWGVRRRAATLVGIHFDEPSDYPLGDPGLQRRLASALETLSMGQREAFVLVHLQDLTVTETADITGRAPGTVKSHLHRALHKLRAELNDLWEMDR
jgi:RNA polymerase sigma factor (sigma-70 family)